MILPMTYGVYIGEEFVATDQIVELSAKTEVPNDDLQRILDRSQSIAQKIAVESQLPSPVRNVLSTLKPFSESIRGTLTRSPAQSSNGNVVMRSISGYIFSTGANESFYMRSSPTRSRSNTQVM